MKFLHTSDLHLGKRLYETSLIEDQRYILNQIIDIIKREGVEAILLPGDIYDRSVAPEEAVTLMSDFLKELHGIGCKTYIIPGNHDSSERVAFANDILSEQDIFISGPFRGTMERYQVVDKNGKLNIWLLPFFRDVSVQLPEGVERNFDNAFKKIIADSGIDPNERNILLSHQFFTAGNNLELGGSEKYAPSIGGEDCISASLLDVFDYAALGHIHSPQAVGKETVRYSGSPLKYSEKENYNDKSVVIGEIESKGKVSIKLIPLRPLRDVRVIEGTVDALIDNGRSGGCNTDDYVYIKLTEPSKDAKQRLSQVYKNILSIVMQSDAAAEELETKSIEDIRRMDPIELFSEMFRKIKGKDMTEKQVKVFKEAERMAKDEEAEL